MCGIAGLFGTGIGTDQAAAEGVRRMVRAQDHRGPDDSGWLATDHAILGHNRLSIIDLSPCGHQPMANEAGTVWTIFNGEIYNHAALHAQLERLGHVFRSRSDTEVLVHGYEAWGIDGLLERLRGMFAFALYDQRPEGSPSYPTGRLILARDRFGIKPLYYAADATSHRIAFASEVRSLRRSGLVPLDQNRTAWLGYLLLGSVPAPQTTLRAVQSIPPGSYLTADVGAHSLTRYYSLDAIFHDEGKGRIGEEAGQRGSLEAYSSRLRTTLEEAVSLHLISDAPLGVFLSGGIDSSALVALAASRQPDLRTVGIVFDDRRLSEESFQRIVAERYGTNHTSVRLTAKDFRDGLPGFLDAMDEPTVDGLNTFFVAGAARQAGLKAVLAGVGGDEIFAGYSTLDRATTLRRFQSLFSPLRRASISLLRRHSTLRRLSVLQRQGAMPFYLAQRGLHTPAEAAAFIGVDERQAWDMLESLEPSDPPKNPVVLQQFLETRHYLVDQLLRDADVFGMAHSLEIRVPLLDHVLVEMVLESPQSWRRDGKWPKPLLSRTLQDLLPREVVFRRKQGFVLPVETWLRSSGAEDLLASSQERSVTMKVWKSFYAGQSHWSRPWSLLVLDRLGPS